LKWALIFAEERKRHRHFPGMDTWLIGCFFYDKTKSRLRAGDINRPNCSSQKMMAYDFVETEDTAEIHLYRTTLDEDTLEPAIEGGRRLIVCNGFHIDLYRDVWDEVSVHWYKSRIEIHMQKRESCMWGTVGGPSARKEERNEYLVVEKEEEVTSAADLFSKIYWESGEDVRRAMEKSLTESGGTVLSTDWDSVKSRRVNPEK
jgi:suppressor of G2 allele of SKP1